MLNYDIPLLSSQPLLLVPQGWLLNGSSTVFIKGLFAECQPKTKMWKKSIQTIHSVISRHIDIENCKTIFLQSNTRLQKSLVSTPLIWPSYKFHAPCPKYCVILAGFNMMYTVILVKMTWMGIYDKKLQFMTLKASTTKFLYQAPFLTALENFFTVQKY